MLFNEEIILAVAESLQAQKALLVVDPVMVATSGDRLLKDAALHQLVTTLFPLATIITPNIPEASALVRLRMLPVCWQSCWCHFNIRVLMP
jgi:hydroxymethylpyrimidine/phosphomethylpyrimidine kinase